MTEYMWIVQAEGFGAREPMNALDAANCVHNIITGWKNLDLPVITVERIQVETTRYIARRGRDV